LEEEDNVYDLVEEDQYAKIVEGRRSESSFVVDDSKSIRY
jgi:DNA polymerase alpha subunit p180 N terminal